MTVKKAVQHRYQIGQVCVFTNRGVSGVKINDGKRCKIVRLKSAEEWAQGEPEYVIHFLVAEFLVDENYGFGVRECELEPTTKKGDVP